MNFFKIKKWILAFVLCISIPIRILSTSINEKKVQLQWLDKNIHSFELTVSPGSGGSLLDDLEKKIIETCMYTSNLDDLGYELEPVIFFVINKSVIQYDQKQTILNAYFEENIDKIEFIFIMATSRKNFVNSKNKHTEIEEKLIKIVEIEEKSSGLRKLIGEKKKELNIIDNKLKNRKNDNALLRAYEDFSKVVFSFGADEITGSIEDFEPILKTYKITNDDSQNKIDGEFRSLINKKRKELRISKKILKKEEVENKIKELQNGINKDKKPQESLREEIKELEIKIKHLQTPFSSLLKDIIALNQVRLDLILSNKNKPPIRNLFVPNNKKNNTTGISASAEEIERQQKILERIELEKLKKQKQKEEEKERQRKIFERNEKELSKGIKASLELEDKKNSDKKNKTDNTLSDDKKKQSGTGTIYTTSIIMFSSIALALLVIRVFFLRLKKSKTSQKKQKVENR